MNLRQVIGDLIAGRTSTKDKAGEASLAQYPYPGDGTTMPALPLHMQYQPWTLSPDVLDAPDILTRLAIARRAVMMRAGDVARTPILWERETRGGKWEPVERKPGNVVDVLARANPIETGFQLLRSWFAFYIGTGSGYLVARRHLGSAAPPTEFWVAESQLVQVIPGRHRSPAAWLYNRSGVREKIDPENMVAMLDWNPKAEPAGTGALASVRHQAQARYDIPRLIAALIANGGNVGGTYKLSVPPGVTATQPSDERVKELEEEINRRVRFDDAWKFKIMPLLDFQRTNLTPTELDLGGIQARLDADIALAFGVYPWMLGIKSSSGGNIGADKSGAEQDVLCYVDETLEADFVLGEGILTERVGAMFEPGIRARFDRSAIPAIMSRRLAVAKMLSDLAGGASISPNEARKFSGLGLEPDPDPTNDEIRQGGFGGGFGTDPATDPNAPPDAKPKDAPPADTPAAKAKRWKETPTQQRKRITRQRLAAERKVMRRFDAIFEKQREAVHSWADDQFGKRARGSRLNVADLLDVDLTDEQAINDIFNDLVLERGEAALAQVASEIDSALLLANASGYVRTQVARVIRDTTRTTANELRESLATISDSIVEGDTYAQTVHRLIDQVFDGRAANARTIARTETVRAYNWAALDAWRMAPEVTHVRWVTAQDDGDRHPSYDGLDGQVRKVGEAFEVGDARLDYPGDPMGPAGETINCRCVLEPEMDPDAIEQAQTKNRHAAIATLFFPNGHGAGSRIARELEAIE